MGSGFIWIHLDPFGSIWIHLDFFGFALGFGCRVEVESYTARTVLSVPYDTSQQAKVCAEVLGKRNVIK